jgi:hypothetical protein
MGNSRSHICLIKGCESKQWKYHHYFGPISGYTTIRSRYCKVHNCKFDANGTLQYGGSEFGCKQKIFFDGMCIKHNKCGYCNTKLRMEGGRYCSEHTCFVDGCLAQIKMNNMYIKEKNMYDNDKNVYITCSSHTCQTALCNRPTTLNSSVCSRQQCKIFDEPIELSFRPDKQADFKYFMKHGNLANIVKKHLTTNENDNNQSPPSYV